MSLFDTFRVLTGIPTKNRTASKRVRLVQPRLESLEDRTTPSVFGANVLAAISGELAAGETAAHDFRIDPEEFSLSSARQMLVLQFTLAPTDNEFRASTVEIVRPDQSLVRPLYAATDTSIGNGSVVVAELAEGSYQLRAQGLNGASGGYQLAVSLVGDVDGDRSVSEGDAMAMRSLLNVSANDEGFRLGADYDLDGRITGFDHSLLVRNRGAAFTAAAPLTFAVNPELQPPFPAFPRISELDPEVRTLSVVRTEAGVESIFVDNELYLLTNSDHELNAFIERWQGTILQSFDPAAHGFPQIPKMFLVHVQTEHADTSLLADDLKQLDPNGSYGAFELSSQRGLKLLTAAAREAAQFSSYIGVSWIGQPSSFPRRTSIEAPTSRAIDEYDPNAFTWPHLADGNAMDTGVAEAWRALQVSGALRRLETADAFEEGKFELAVFDNGFANDDDWPSWEGMENVGSPLGGPTPWPGKEWHGGGVIQSAAGVPDNNFGGAGPGGPVVDIIAIPTTYDPFLTAVALMRAVTERGADLVNMSWHTPVPVPLTFGLLPWEAITSLVHETGTLIFASAGNENANIDDEVDLWIFGSFEPLWYTPAENAGGLAVGGIEPKDDGTVAKASQSNYGARDVDIFAPWIVWVGPNSPTDHDNSARLFAGSSASAPFAAGVAALIWAANPDLGADEVERVLINTAHTTTPPPARVNRWVDALTGVAFVLGDIPPHIEIEFPFENSEFLRFTQPVALFAFADDYEGPVSVTWTSDRDGVIYTGEGDFPRSLSYGTHIITATARDSIGQTAQDQVTIRIVSQDPVVTIIQPAHGTGLLAGTIRFSASTRDNDYNNNPVPDDFVSWSHRRLGDTDWIPFLEPTGHITSQAFAPGEYEARVTASDGVGGLGEATASFTVVAAVGQKPTVTILSPAQGFVRIQAHGFEAATGRYFIDFEWGGITKAFAAVVTDPDGAVVQERIVWRTNRVDLHPDDGGVLGHGAIIEVRLYVLGGFDADLRHTITATYTDDDGNPDSDSLLIEFAGILL